MNNKNSLVLKNKNDIWIMIFIITFQYEIYSERNLHTHIVYDKTFQIPDR